MCDGKKMENPRAAPRTKLLQAAGARAETQTSRGIVDRRRKNLKRKLEFNSKDHLQVLRPASCSGGCGKGRQARPREMNCEKRGGHRGGLAERHYDVAAPGPANGWQESASQNAGLNRGQNTYRTQRRRLFLDECSHRSDAVNKSQHVPAAARKSTGGKSPGRRVTAERLRGRPMERHADGRRRGVANGKAPGDDPIPAEPTRTSGTAVRRAPEPAGQQVHANQHSLGLAYQHNGAHVVQAGAPTQRRTPVAIFAQQPPGKSSGAVPWAAAGARAEGGSRAATIRRGGGWWNTLPVTCYAAVHEAGARMRAPGGVRRHRLEGSALCCAAGAHAGSHPAGSPGKDLLKSTGFNAKDARSTEQVALSNETMLKQQANVGTPARAGGTLASRSLVWGSRQQPPGAHALRHEVKTFTSGSRLQFDIPGRHFRKTFWNSPRRRERR